jgi:2-polyprenyl-6-methoxyphenol hydroxylase-like FAD-dependent oxidoreductase
MYATWRSPRRFARGREYRPLVWVPHTDRDGSFFIAPRMASWSSPTARVVVLGDAAHAMIPTGGLGASLALEDAECLFHVIEKATSEPKTLQNGMKLWEGHRRERLALIQDFTNRNRQLRAPGGTRMMQTLKEWFMWAFFKVLGSGGQAAPIYGYDTEVFAKRLT